jgi:hypothetical protein
VALEASRPLPPAMRFASGRARGSRRSCWRGTIAVKGVRMGAKKVFGILRKFARGSHAVYAGSFQSFEPPAPAVGFLYLISQFCIRRPGIRAETGSAHLHSIGDALAHVRFTLHVHFEKRSDQA